VKRAYSLIRFKASEEDEERVIEGMATTPTPDRVGDIVDPMGAKFASEIPLHLYHDSSLPVGTVKFGRPTKKGIPFKATLPIVTEPGTVRDRVDEAWHSLKYKLIGAVSIGFRVMREVEDAVEYMESGIRFLKTEIMELSLVSIPANPEAVITGVKSIDRQIRAASGHSTGLRVVRLNQKSASVLAQESIDHKGNTQMKNLQEQIKATQAARKALTDRMEALLTDAEKDGGRTLNEQEDEEYNEKESEVEAVDKHLRRLEKLQKLQVKKAQVVDTGSDDEEVDEENDGTDEKKSNGKRSSASGISIPREKKLPPGVEFARYAMALGSAKGDLPRALSIAKRRFADSPRVVSVLKAAVAAGTTTDADWAGDLLEYNLFTGDFIEYLRPQTIIGKFGQGGVPALRGVPFNINVNAQTSGGAGYWVGQGAPKPLTSFGFDKIYLGFTKVASIAVLTEELLRFSNPNAELLVRDALAAALIERLDTDFVDPEKAAVSNVSPASITNGVTPVASSGDDADAIRADVAALMAAYIAANMTPTSGVWIMPATIALGLSLIYNPLGQPEFPGISMSGGTFAGLPVIVSQYVNSDTDGADVILANAQDIYLADDGVVTIDASREASLQMDNAPTNNASTGTGASMVSMFQTNSVALRAERFINWKKRRTQAVQYLSGVGWGTIET
jgi:HK97 family phage major capsid protein/HK97 family phage prohead protease